MVGGLAAPAVAAQPAPDQAWVEMAPGGGSVARVLTRAATCPALRVDGRMRAMDRRADPAVLPVRTNKAEVAEAAAFPARICELALPRATRHASLAGRALPLPRARIERIVLIGDTGCRLKAADKAWQPCNDRAQWPFADIARKAAALHPDMVLHVGDYLYRENPCPEGEAGCSGAIWGYGEQGWRVDFLAPAAPLLAAAPWIVVRGNHEECARAGQGWWRLLDPHPLQAGRDCVDPASDAEGDHAPPYAVDLGGSARLIVADLVGLANGKPKEDAALRARYRADFARISALTRGSRDNFVTAHYPFNAVIWGKDGSVEVGTKPVAAFAPLDLAGVRAMFAGHVHFFQYAHAAGQPVQVVTGFSGTAEDPPGAPSNLADVRGKAGADKLRALTTIENRFGYALLERKKQGWRLTAFAADGATLGRFAR